MFVQDVLNAVNCKLPSSSVWKKDASVTSLWLSEPGFEHGASDFGQRRATLSSAFADDSQMRSDAEDQIFAFESSHLRETKAGLGRCQDKGVVTPPEPCTLVWSGEQSIHLCARQKLHQGTREALTGDGENPLDLRGMGWNLERGIAKQRVDGRQAQVASSDADAVVLLNVVQKLPDQRSSDVLETQLRGVFVQALLDESQQLMEGVAIGADGVWAHLALLHQPA